jgi:hypothetical protein
LQTSGTGKERVQEVEPDEQDLVAFLLIEDTAEIRLAQPNLVRFEVRRGQNASPTVEIRDLLKAALRHCPDRIMLGEIRGGEAFDLRQLLNIGHSGLSPPFTLTPQSPHRTHRTPPRTPIHQTEPNSFPTTRGDRIKIPAPIIFFHFTACPKAQALSYGLPRTGFSQHVGARQRAPRLADLRRFRSSPDCCRGSAARYCSREAVRYTGKVAALQCAALFEFQNVPQIRFRQRVLRTKRNSSPVLGRLRESAVPRQLQVDWKAGKYLAGESINCSVELATHRLGYSVAAAIWQREGLRSAKRDRAERK